MEAYVIEAKTKEARERIKGFWTAYVSDLKYGRIKEAYRKINLGEDPAGDPWVWPGRKEELPKFHKGLFGVKYLGDASALDVEKLVEYSMQRYDVNEDEWEEYEREE